MPLSKTEQLSKAISIAVKAHEGQEDKGGAPYILHPLHLMNQLMFDYQLATIAVLHDVIEDTDVTIAELKNEGMSPRVISALSLLTHDTESQEYFDYIEGICSNYDAIRVKRKDLQHNSDITRLKGLRRKDFDRIERYQKAFVRLTQAKRDFE